MIENIQSVVGIHLLNVYYYGKKVLFKSVGLPFDPNYQAPKTFLQGYHRYKFQYAFHKRTVNVLQFIEQLPSIGSTFIQMISRRNVDVQSESQVGCFSAVLKNSSYSISFICFVFNITFLMRKKCAPERFVFFCLNPVGSKTPTEENLRRK